MAFTTPLMIGIQLVSTSMPRVMPAWLTSSVVTLLLCANTLNIAADIAAMGESLRLLKWLTLTLLSYVAVALMLHQTTAQAAEALRPLAGEFAFTLFAAGIIGTGMLAVPVLAASSEYAVADVLQWRSGLDSHWLEARGFYTVIGFGTAIGTLLNFTALDPIKALVWSAVMAAAVTAMFVV